MIKKLLLWFMQTDFYETLVLKVVPFVRFSTYYTSLRGNQYHAGYSLLKKGDILLTYDKHKITTVLVPGEFTHACFVTGDCRKGDEFEVVEMTHRNFTRSSFFDVMKESDRVVILRCVDFDDEYIEKMAQKALSFKDAKYDVMFDFNVKALYCSELVYQADFEKRLKVDISDLHGLGQEYLSPDGLYRTKNVAVVWDSKNMIPLY